MNCQLNCTPYLVVFLFFLFFSDFNEILKEFKPIFNLIIILYIILLLLSPDNMNCNTRVYINGIKPNSFIQYGFFCNQTFFLKTCSSDNYGNVSLKTPWKKNGKSMIFLFDQNWFPSFVIL